MNLELPKNIIFDKINEIKRANEIDNNTLMLRISESLIRTNIFLKIYWKKINWIRTK